MPASDFYWSKRLIPGFGKMWFPLAIQEATSSGGGLNLLGSVVEELKGGLFGLFERYPAPYSMAKPRLILEALQHDAVSLGINGTIVEAEKLSAPAMNLQFSKKDALKLGAGPFPSLPVALNLDVDYSLMEKIEIRFGASVDVEFIPTDYLARLYRQYGGDARKALPGVAIEVDANYIVDQVLLARDFSIAFESSQQFDAEFDAKLEALKALPNVGGKIDIGRESSRRVVIGVSGGPTYLVAFKTLDWDDLG